MIGCDDQVRFCVATILFVDDIVEVREISRTFLEGEGFAVAVAANGREALESLQRQRPDLIISDILMPEMDGFEFCRAIKSDPETCAIPFLFYTSTFLNECDREFAATLGVVEYLIKPMRPADFLGVVKRVLAGTEPSAPPLAAVAGETFALTYARILSDKLHKKAGGFDSARRDIEAHHSQFSRLVNSLAEPVAEISGDLRFVYVNRAFMDWLGVGQGVLYGEAVETLLGGKFYEALSRFINQHRLEEGLSERLIEVALSLPGHHHSECRVTLLADQSGWDERYIALFSRDGMEFDSFSVDHQCDAMTEMSIPSLGAKDALAAIIGISQARADLISDIRQVAATAAAVLVQGESGTGKELVADAIHALSDRRNGPLVKVNCGAIPAGLFESELFGHEKGAFTSAYYRRIGRFEQASGGTIFLDEVAELSPEMQVKLLRVLQEGIIERVGATLPTRVDVRLIAATNSELEARVRERNFRDDLFYRLNVFPLLIPPLQQRPEDIPLLVNHFLRQFAQKNGKTVSGIATTALRRLQEYSWPGNIRQLQNVLERAVILAQGRVIQASEIKLPQAALVAQSATQPQTLVEVERAHILEVLDRTHWSIAGRGGAAELLGMNPSTLRSRMKKYGIQRPQQ